MLNRELLEIMISEIDERCGEIDRRLADCPQASLNIENRRGRLTPVLVTKTDGTRHRRVLRDDPELVGRLIEAEMFRKEKSVLESDRAAVAEALSKYRDFSRFDEQQRLAEKYGALYMPADVIKALSEDERKWIETPYETSNYKPEMKTQITSRGLAVRSKSELLIAEKLYEHDLPFRYEQPIHFERTDVIPDFTIRRKDGKIFYWEHEGLTNLKSYTDWQRRKADLYAGIGIVPWDNYIVTYDTPGGTIDLRVVDFEIKNRLLAD